MYYVEKIALFTCDVSRLKCYLHLTRNPVGKLCHPKWPPHSPPLTSTTHHTSCLHSTVHSVQMTIVRSTCVCWQTFPCVVSTRCCTHSTTNNGAERAQCAEFGQTRQGEPLPPPLQRCTDARALDEASSPGCYLVPSVVEHYRQPFVVAAGGRAPREIRRCRCRGGRRRVL